MVTGLLVIGLVGWWWSPKGVEVVRIVDGDNVVLADGREIRYINVDTPEVGECFRDESTEINRQMVLGKKVRIEYDYDKIGPYGRELAYVWVTRNGKEMMVNEYLLARGVGEFQVDNNNTKYLDRLVEAARIGHEEEKGKWSQCGGETGCVIKGNWDKDDHRWYHLPEFRHYDQVVMRLDLRDRWFCSEAEAVKAKFERARE